MSQRLSLSQVVGMGAKAGVIAACDHRTQRTQIQNLFEVLKEYEYPDSVNVLQLYIAYQAGRGHIDRNTAKQLIQDIRQIASSTSDNKEGKELLRSYLGAVRWAYTAIDRGRPYRACRAAQRLRPVLDDVIRALFNLS